MTISVRGRPICAKGTEPCFGASLRVIDLGRLIAARRQILAIGRKPDTTNDANGPLIGEFLLRRRPK